MENVVKMRRYRTADVSGSQFLPTTNQKNLDFANDDLSKSGLTLDDIEADAPSALYMAEGAVAGYVIPYFDLKGRPLVDDSNRLAMYRVKLNYPMGVRGPKYIGPSAEQLGRNKLTVCIPYIPPGIHVMSGEEIICAEGEKKTASIVKHLGLPAFGIGGCQMWRDPDGSGRPHPWILELLRIRCINSIVIVPDGDITRYDISTAYGTFARALEQCGFAVKILHTPGKIDDLLVEWADDKLRNWSDIPALAPESLVQSPKSLIERYSLAFKTDAKGNPTVHQHTSNIMRLMEEHQAFPKVWLNQDDNQVMIGDEQSEPNRTDMDIANYFQYNLGFDKVTDRLIHNCVMSLARTNKRSPFLDWVRAQIWDGTERLDGWLNAYWGVEDTPYVREVSSKWLISACARLDKPGTKLDWIFIVVGPQATGKTTMPSILFKDSSLTLYGEHNDKDLHMLMHSALCVGFDELDSFGKRETSNLKAMITRNEDAFRPPYGITTEVFPRRFTLYGCGNRYNFLQHDPSGYRRYAVIEVSRLLDFDGLERDRGQLWAEAYFRYMSGNVKYWMVEGAAEEAEKYAIPNVMEDQIRAFVNREIFNKQSTQIKGGHFYFTMTTVLKELDILNASRNSNITRDVAAILKNVKAEQSICVGPNGGAKQRYYKIKID